MLDKQLLADSRGEPPKDHWNFCYILVFIQGLGVLFPWNTLISATDYWDRRMCGSHFSKSHMNFFSIGFNIANVTFMFLCVRYQHRFSLAKRIVISTMTLAVIFLFITLNVLIGPDKMDGDTLFGITMVLVLLTGAADSIFQAGIFGLAACLPPIYSQAVMAGQGLAGVTSAVSLVITVYAGSKAPGNQVDVCSPPEDYELVKWNSFAFFLFSSLILVACVFGFVVLNNHPFVRFYTTRRDTILTGSEMDYESQPTQTSDGESTSDNIQDATAVLYDDPADITPALNTPTDSMSIFRRMKHLWFAVLLVFMCTLAVFPTVTSQFQSTTDSDSPFFKALWIPISCFLNFNVFDFLGRISAGFYPQRWLVAGNGKWLLPACICRLIFIPAFLLCDLKGGVTPNVFMGDTWPLVIMMLFAFTNGYFASLCMMMGPKHVETHQMATAGTVMAFGLNIGLCLGSFSSFATSLAFK